MIMIMPIHIQYRIYIFKFSLNKLQINIHNTTIDTIDNLHLHIVKYTCSTIQLLN